MTDSADGIHISREAIGHALSDKRLAVPVNQRSYAWEEEHVLDLFQDLANAIAADEREYFLGSIVVTKNNGEPSEVADGQQRLATTTILLAAIRDYLLTNRDAEGAGEIERTYLASKHIRTRETVPRLRLNEMDNDFFGKRVLLHPSDQKRKEAQPQKDSHKRIHTAAKLAAKRVKDIVAPYKEADRIDRLMDWVEYIRDRARVIWVTVPDDQNAFTIFETLNDRGLALSIADLLKNYLFGRSGDRIKEVQQQWTTMTTALESVSREDITVTYIRHLWASVYGPTRERELYGNIKKTIRGKQAAVDLASNLADEAKLYAALLNPNHQVWNSYGTSARRHIGTLRQLQMEQIRPLLLALIKHFPVGEAKKALRLFVSWSVRFLVVGGLGGGTMEKHYALRAVEVRSGKITTLRELAKAMADVVPSDGVFESAFATARVSQAHLARYYLRALELQVKGDKEPELVPNTEEDFINLEHILPQNPSAAWNYWNQDMAEAYYKRIGNMALLKATANAAAAFDAFKDKKAVFKKSGFVLTSEVGNHNSAKWRPADIDKRQLRLAALAVKTWPLSTT